MKRYEAHMIAEELAERLGVSASWIYHKAESPPRIKVGRSYRFSLNEVIEALK